MKLCRFIVGLSFVFLGAVSADTTVVVTRIDSDIGQLHAQELSQLWLKQIYYINDIRIDIADLDEKDHLRQTFYKHVVGKYDNKLAAYWSIRVFRGEDFPPATFETQQALIDWLVASKNRLGYIDSGNLNEKLKSVFVAEISTNEGKE
jgi:hypothetical protein